jgi:hypothetical protein
MKESKLASPEFGLRLVARGGGRLSASAASLGWPAPASPQRRPATDALGRLRPERSGVGFCQLGYTDNISISQFTTESEAAENEQYAKLFLAIELFLKRCVNEEASDGQGWTGSV